jgi:hypothetical protein
VLGCVIALLLYIRYSWLLDEHAIEESTARLATLYDAINLQFIMNTSELPLPTQTPRTRMLKDGSYKESG